MKIENVRLEVVDNGFKLCYTELTKRDKKDQFENRMCNYKELVFKDEDSDEAMNEFVKYAKLSREKDNMQQINHKLMEKNEY